LLYEHLRKENVIYAEIRCSPGNYADPRQGRSAWDVLGEIIRTFDECRETNPPGAVQPRVNLLIIATRKDGGDFRTGISRHLSLAVTAAEHWRRPDGCRVVGVDLAGYEDRATRAHYFREDFTAVHRAGLAVTVHAGENDDAEAIWSAVFDLNARRIGHALHLIQSPALLEVVASRGIGVEMCPYANQQIVGFALSGPAGNGGTETNYPLSDYLAMGIPVSVNTDNIGISGASLTENLLLAVRLCPGLSRLDLLTLIRNSIQTTFLPELERQRLSREFAGWLARAREEGAGVLS
jgi:adenosine deaminase